MADDADLAALIADDLVAAGVAAARAPIAPGTAGDCDNCGEFFGRLVGGQCGFCRDGRRPQYDRTPPVLPEPEPDDEDDAPIPVKEPVAMPPAQPPAVPRVVDRQFTFRASGALMLAIERRADDLDIPLGRAAMDYAEMGMLREQEGGLPEEPLIVPEPLTPRQQLVALLDGVSDLLRAQIERAEVADPDALAAANERAEAAEARLAQVKAAVGI